MMRDGHGDLWFQANVVQSSTNEIVRSSSEYPVPFSDRRRSKLILIRLMDVVFTEPGEYLVELFCNNEFVVGTSDRNGKIRVTSVDDGKAESGKRRKVLPGNSGRRCISTIRCDYGTPQPGKNWPRSHSIGGIESRTSGFRRNRRMSSW